MSGDIAHWLAGRRALVAGVGEAADVVASALSLAGATTERLPQPSIDAPAIAGAFDAAEASLGGTVDLLVHAGVPIPAVSAETIGLEAWRAGLSADIDGRFLFAAEFGRRLIAADAGGSILLMLPSAASGAGRSALATAGGAMANLVKSLATEWGRLGIRTNAIRSRACEPGGLQDSKLRASLGHLAAYLSSGYAAYVTGCVMGVDEI